MSRDFKLYHEIRGLRLEEIDKRNPWFFKAVERQEEVRRKGLEALDRAVEGHGIFPGWDLPRPFFCCYSYVEHHDREYLFKSFDDVMAFAQLLSMSNAAQHSEGLVKVQYVSSSVKSLAYVNTSYFRRVRFEPAGTAARKGKAAKGEVTEVRAG
ncbi:MAG: hypothetical protein ABFS45_21070 [Pseudomonadota bacterium]